MKRAIYLQRDYEHIGTIKDLTSVFEAIASIHIAQVRAQVLSSTAFFDELWQLYSQLRRDKNSKLNQQATRTRPALVAVTSDGGLIGDIDQRIVKAMLQHPEREGCDVYVIGNHGASLLTQNGVRPLKTFNQPKGDKHVNVTQLATLLKGYKQATVYYQTYISLTRQDVARIDLFSAVEALSQTASENQTHVISGRDYIFEPSLDEVIAYMEAVMMEVALGQVILESKLAQYASRFNAMNAAKEKADDMHKDLRLQLNRAKRSQGDERVKEITSVLKITSSDS